MDVKPLDSPAGPAEMKGQATPRASTSPSGTLSLSPSSEASDSRVEPNQRKRRISVFVDEATGRPVFIVVDDETGEAVREVPPEKVLKLAVRMEQMVGALFSEVV